MNGFLLKSSYDDPARQSLEAKKAADALVDAYGGPLDFDGINVTVRIGYNIGITNFTQSSQHFFLPRRVADPKSLTVPTGRRDRWWWRS